MAPFKADLSSH